MKMTFCLLALFISFAEILFPAATLQAAESSDQPQVQDLSAWDKIYIGMADKEVESLLGTPKKKRQLRGYDQILHQWEYPNGGYVRFYMHQVRSIYKPKDKSSN